MSVYPGNKKKVLLTGGYYVQLVGTPCRLSFMRYLLKRVKQYWNMTLLIFNISNILTFQALKSAVQRRACGGFSVFIPEKSTFRADLRRIYALLAVQI